jgi:hypothetical protein
MVARQEQVDLTVAVDVSTRTHIVTKELPFRKPDPSGVEIFDGHGTGCGQGRGEMEGDPASVFCTGKAIGTVGTDEDIGQSVTIDIPCTRTRSAHPRAGGAT